ncbi:peptidase S49, ClpP/crotonase-like domain protein [Artemisia annua]|uniref:Peptidase S49, ClpP/crotonase-like domain protein n=1 Tax=Artemisia annua TaxID=35608 RepID=A0A2U1KN91_ARTAN|nr:peptidase S49, ClpP/crotonase-like domain protein [Artemisia annua]
MDYRKVHCAYATEWQEMEYYIGCVYNELQEPPSSYFMLFGLTQRASLLGGKKKEEIETFINEGVYHIEKLNEDGWITYIKYDDEVPLRLCAMAILIREQMEWPSVPHFHGFKQTGNVKAY